MALHIFVIAFCTRFKLRIDGSYEVMSTGNFLQLLESLKIINNGQSYSVSMTINVVVKFVKNTTSLVMRPEQLNNLPFFYESTCHFGKC